MLIVAPIAAVIVSNADILLLARADPHVLTGRFMAALAITVPFSLLACVVTILLLLRLRGEIDHRTQSENNLRAALAQRDEALEAARRAHDELTSSLNRERMLRQELDHRVRNNLAALLGLVGMYEASDTPPTAAAGSLRGKIMALREAYSLISASRGEGIELIELHRTVLATAMDDADSARVTLAGPSVLLSSREANAFAMIVQELVTNAVKHGALRSKAGSIRITWASQIREREARVAMRWEESGIDVAPRPKPATGGGMGLSLIEGLATGDLRGNIHFTKDSTRWIVDLTACLAVPGRTNDLRQLGKEIYT